jgi:hypothetical protein
MTRVEQFLGADRADVTRAASDKNVHGENMAAARGTSKRKVSPAQKSNGQPPDFR